LTYEEFASGRERLELDGDELAALYLALTADEEALDRFQASALETIRGLLYERMTIEQLEAIRESYGRRLGAAKRGEAR